jgi:TM2 domain-containing membrane protein YozV
MYVTTEQLRSAVPEDSRASNGTMAVVYTIITCGIYQIYWNYVIADKISKAAEKRELTIENKGIWYIILSLIGFFIVAVALIQNDINLIAERPVAE